jgi:hypothetical protein
MPVTSFLPEDFGTGRWAGGRAKITYPRIEKREWSNDETGDSGAFIVAAFDAIDEESVKRTLSYRIVGNAKYCVIRTGTEEGAPEAEVGYAVSHIDPTRAFKIDPNSEYAKFISNAVSAGFPLSQLRTGDIRVFDGVEMDLAPQPRLKADGTKDRFDIMLPTKIYGTSGSASAKKNGPASAATAKPAAGSDEVRSAATEIVLEVGRETPGEPVKVRQLIDRAMSNLAGNKIKPLVTQLFTGVKGVEFLSSLDGVVYDADEKTITVYE